MLKRLLFGVLISACVTAAALAGSMTLLGVGKPAGGGGGGCSEATTLLARMDGSQNTSAVTTLACGLVTDGIWSKLDTFYMLAINSTANANLNWVSTSFSLSCSNSPTFTANQGYTGNAFNTFCDTGYNASTAGGNYTLNSSSFGFCSLTSRTTNQPYAQMGAVAGGNVSLIEPYAFSALIYYEINDAGFVTPAAGANANGLYSVVRTASNATVVYRNGSSLTTGSQTSSAIPNANFYILAYNNAGTGADYTADQISMAYTSGSLNATEAGNLRTRVQTYMATVNGSGC